MKRIFALLLALSVLITAAASAEDTVFTLENGLRWGLNQSEIFELLGEDGSFVEPLYDGMDMIQYTLDTDIADDDCSVMLSMMLVDSRLALIMYDFMRVDDPSVKEGYIAAMTAEYGQPIEDGMDRFVSSLGLLYLTPEMTAADLGAKGTGFSWELDDGTYMGVYDLTDISFGVYFVNETLFAEVTKFAEAAFAAAPATTDDDETYSLSEFIDEASQLDTEDPNGYLTDFIVPGEALWDKPMDSIIELAGLVNFTYNEDEANGVKSLWMTDVNYLASYDSMYVFRDDALVMRYISGYAFYDDNLESILVDEVSAIYGEPTCTDSDTLFAILEASGLNSFASAEEMTAMGFNADISWRPEDGSLALLMVNGPSYTFYMIGSSIVSGAGSASE